SHEAVKGIENMALSFLSQLSTFGRTSHASTSYGTKDHPDDFSDISTARHRAKTKIELQLVDRSKRDALGCLKYPKKCVNGGFRPMGMYKFGVYAHDTE
ncbi:hypothetical protein C0992_012302, partial [Termitomyces sp. T32_za158]